MKREGWARGLREGREVKEKKHAFSMPAPLIHITFSINYYTTSMHTVNEIVTLYLLK